MTDAVTADRLLGGRVLLQQPAEGYRVAIDPVFLAAAVPALDGQSVVDLGCGVGAASLCLLQRVPGARVVGLEIQRALFRLASANARANNMAGRFTPVVGDILSLPPRFAPGSFDHVMVNPPYLEAGKATSSPKGTRAIADQEGEAQLSDWVRVALLLVRDKGSVTFIQRADRLEKLLAAFDGKAGELLVYPLWPKPGRPARRVLVRARKNVLTPTRLLAGLPLHKTDGSYTDTAEAVLRDAARLDLTAADLPDGQADA
ncbi:methyltransferase [Limibacillus sp. MBR-115]|jgi:tRNA1(Val) A37 N6-methylase TrmN6|uniref:tRNA1(Val) (adenine(37)-N6)-methyltransferase n=1 Tax=Limibacillus sp. MBR-115 TaxID=3156465 RepID=UPI003393EF06